MEDRNKNGIIEVKTSKKELSSKNLFSFFIKNFELYTKVEDSFSKFFLNIEEIKNILDSEEKNQFLFFFFREKLFVKFQTKQTNLPQ